MSVEPGSCTHKVLGYLDQMSPLAMQDACSLPSGPLGAGSWGASSYIPKWKNDASSYFLMPSKPGPVSRLALLPA